MKKTVLLGTAAFVLAACGSSNEASESHFKKVIKESGNNRNVCLPLMLDIETPNGIPAQNVMLGEPVLLISDHSADGKRINQITGSPRKRRPIPQTQNRHPAAVGRAQHQNRHLRADRQRRGTGARYSTRPAVLRGQTENRQNQLVHHTHSRQRPDRIRSVLPSRTETRKMGRQTD